MKLLTKRISYLHVVQGNMWIGKTKLLLKKSSPDGYVTDIEMNYMNLGKIRELGTIFL